MVQQMHRDTLQRKHTKRTEKYDRIGPFSSSEEAAWGGVGLRKGQMRSVSKKKTTSACPDQKQQRTEKHAERERT